MKAHPRLTTDQRDRLMVRLFKVEWKLSNQKDPLLRFAEAIVKSIRAPIKNKAALHQWLGMRGCGKPRCRINVAALVGGRTADSAADTPSARQGAIGPRGQSRR